MMHVPSPHKVRHELAQHQSWKQRLHEKFPDIEDNELFDTLDGLTDLQECLGTIIRSALLDEAMARGLKDRLDDMKARLARFAKNADAKRQIASECMADADIKKLVQADFTASLRLGVSGVVIVNADEIPETYKIPQEPKLDRRLLLDHLRYGQDVPGAALDNPKMTLTVRTK